jgi:hypothetical protein
MGGDRKGPRVITLFVVELFAGEIFRVLNDFVPGCIVPFYNFSACIILELLYKHTVL